MKCFVGYLSIPVKRGNFRQSRSMISKNIFSGRTQYTTIRSLVSDSNAVHTNRYRLPLKWRKYLLPFSGNGYCISIFSACDTYQIRTSAVVGMYPPER